MLHRREWKVNILEPVIAEAYGVRTLTNMTINLVHFHCVLFDRPHLSMISQKQRKSRFCVRPLCTRWSLGHLSFGLENFCVHWKIIGRLKRSLRSPWAFVERSLRDCFPWRSLRDCFGQSQNFQVILEIIGKSLRDLGNHWAFFERLVRDLAIFLIAQRSLNDCHPCVKGV